MIFLQACHRRALFFLLPMLCLGQSSADVTLKNWQQPIFIEPSLSIDSAQTPATDPTQTGLPTVSGEQFNFVFPEAIVHHGAVIAADTRVQGHVLKTVAASRWGRPGYVLVDFTDIVPPNAASQPLTLEPVKMGLSQSRTGKALITRQIITGVATSAAVLPVSLATSLSFWPIFGIRSAVGGAVGAIQEARIQDPEDARSTWRKSLDGAAKGILVFPAAWPLIKKSPDVAYSAHTAKLVQLPKPLWKALFEAENSLPEHSD
jgi:hypothetical protein